MIRRAVVALVAAAALAGCGVSAESEARPLPLDVVVSEPSPAAAEDRAGLLTELWFVQDDALRPAQRTTARAMSAEDKIRALEAGPTSVELAAGMRTAVTAVTPDVPLVITAQAAGIPVPTLTGGYDEVPVVLSREFQNLPSQEQLLILGQIVLTLASTPGSSVLFVNDTGAPVGVPVSGGRLSSGAVTSSDYAGLIG